MCAFPRQTLNLLPHSNVLEFHFYAVIRLPLTVSRNYIVSLLPCGARLWSIFRLILLFADQLTCTSAAGAAIRQGNQHIIHTKKEQWVRAGRCKPSRVIKVALGHTRIHIPIPSFRHPYYPSCTSSMTATAAAATTSAATLSFILIGFLLDRTTRFRSWGAAKGRVRTDTGVTCLCERSLSSFLAFSRYFVAFGCV